jgi:NADPH-dependent ferric siderophore reductase
MSDKMPSRGFQGAVLKLLRAADYRLTVTGPRELTPHYLRLSFDGGGLLTDRPLHPTMWIRMWFADGEKQHQRGYTLGGVRQPNYPRGGQGLPRGLQDRAQID